MEHGIRVKGFRRDASRPHTNTCIAYLKQMDSAKEQWAMDNHEPVGAKVTFSDLVGPTLYMKAKATCSKPGKYILGRIGTKSWCTVEGHVLPEKKTEKLKLEMLW